LLLDKLISGGKYQDSIGEAREVDKLLEPKLNMDSSKKNTGNNSSSWK